MAAAEPSSCINDIHSLEREERRGDPHNLVTVLGTTSAAPQEAIDAAVDLTHRYLGDYLRLEAQVPELCDKLGLDPADREAVNGRRGHQGWIRGNHDWARNTGRYAADKSGPAAEAERRGQGAVDDLLWPVADGLLGSPQRWRDRSVRAGQRRSAVDPDAVDGSPALIAGGQSRRSSRLSHGVHGPLSRRRRVARLG